MDRVTRPTSQTLASIAQNIWYAGLQSVDSRRLVKEFVRAEGDHLTVGGNVVRLSESARIVVVGAGKAGAGMSRGLIESLTPIVNRHPITGWVNVPDDCAEPLAHVQLFAARPPGMNLPTERVLHGTRQIVELVRQCRESDLCICLISGGGSALLALPEPPVTLAEQIEMINFLSSRKANIFELNSIRKQISGVKGGKLARFCRCPLVCLIVSDVIGDPLDVIASGPTCPNPSTSKEALNLVRRFDPDRTAIARSIHELLARKADLEQSERSNQAALEHVSNYIVGNIQTAIDAATRFAREAGWLTSAVRPTRLEGTAESVGVELAEEMLSSPPRSDRQCWISGGEPVVELAPAETRGRGGRNQQLVLAAAQHIRQRQAEIEWLKDFEFCLLSGGTDGEDGPTDAAGAWIDSDGIKAVNQLGLDPNRYLARNDAYHFFEKIAALFITGPTHTNVCDLRVLLMHEAANSALSVTGRIWSAVFFLLPNHCLAAPSRPGLIDALDRCC